MANKNTKTNAERILDAAKLKYEVLHYDYPKDMDFSAEVVAELIDVPVESSFKTLCARGKSGKFYIFVIPANEELDLKKAAAAANEKNVELVHVKELRDITGYERGSVSPIGLKKPYPTFFEESALMYDEIVVSGGAKGVSVKCSPDTLTEFLGAAVCDLV